MDGPKQRVKSGMSWAGSCPLGAALQALVEEVVEGEADFGPNQHYDGPLQRIALPVLQDFQKVLQGGERGADRFSATLAACSAASQSHAVALSVAHSQPH